MEWSVFIRLQIAEMKKHRWLESEKAGRDLSQDAELDWVRRYAALFRTEMERIHGPIRCVDRRCNRTTGAYTPR